MAAGEVVASPAARFAVREITGKGAKREMQNGNCKHSQGSVAAFAETKTLQTACIRCMQMYARLVSVSAREGEAFIDSFTSSQQEPEMTVCCLHVRRLSDLGITSNRRANDHSKRISERQRERETERRGERKSSSKAF